MVDSENVFNRITTQQTQPEFAVNNTKLRKAVNMNHKINKN